jgi:nucleolar protein 56
MVVDISECVLGVFAFDENGRMIDSVQFPREVGEIARRLGLVRGGTPTDEHRELIKKLVDGGHKQFYLESKELAVQLRAEFKGVGFDVSAPNKAGEILRSSLCEVAKKVGVERVDKLVREVNLLLTREQLRKEAAERDKLIIQAIDMLDELDKTINTMVGRIREWYSIHFPELDRLVPEHQEYLKLILEVGAREKFTAQAIEAAVGFPEKRIKKILKAAETSLGGAFDSLDVKALHDCAKEVLAMSEVRERVAQYVDGLMAQVAPNINAVVGSGIGARLISLAGGIEELARMPASTLQILGAEKALFRALRTHRRPPKHGVIYQYPDIRGAPRWQRGKMARALAGKLTIAARVDALSGEFVGDKLAADLKARMADIKMRHRKPKGRKR